LRDWTIIKAATQLALQDQRGDRRGKEVTQQGVDQSFATNVAMLDTMQRGVLAADQQQSWETTSPPCVGSSRQGLG